MTDRFVPRDPDPALLPPEKRPGVRLHRYPPNRLQLWVYGQGEVWVDFWGNEHELAQMPDGYLRNVIGFCHERADLVRALLTIDQNSDTPGCADDTTTPADGLIPFNEFLLQDANAWLETTPLLQALRRQLALRSRPTDDLHGRDRPTPPDKRKETR